MRLLHHPGGEDGNKGAGEQIRGDHRKADCERQRNEQLPSNPFHEERRNKYGQDTQHRKQSGNYGPFARFKNSLGARNSGKQLRVNIFNFHRSLVHEDTYGERQAA